MSLLKEVGFDLEIQTFECNGHQECRCGFSNDYFTKIRKWLYKTGKKVIKKDIRLPYNQYILEFSNTPQKAAT